MAREIADRSVKTLLLSYLRKYENPKLMARELKTSINNIYKPYLELIKEFTTLNELGNNAIKETHIMYVSPTQENFTADDVNGDEWILELHVYNSESEFKEKLKSFPKFGKDEDELWKQINSFMGAIISYYSEMITKNPILNQIWLMPSGNGKWIYLQDRRYMAYEHEPIIAITWSKSGIKSTAYTSQMFLNMT